MNVYVFRGAGYFYGFTEQRDGANLSAGYGPWTAYRVVDLRAAPPQVDLDPAKLTDCICRNGFYITNRDIKFAGPAATQPQLANLPPADSDRLVSLKRHAARKPLLRC